MNKYKIKSLHIENVRAIKSATVRFADGITVLIGENGAGKSTILECLEILRKIRGGRFMEDLYEQHGGLKGLLRKGESSLLLRISAVEQVAHKVETYTYEVVLSAAQGAPVVLKESFRDDNHILMYRDSKRAYYEFWFDAIKEIKPEDIKADELLINSYGMNPPVNYLSRMIETLAGIEVQLRFDTLARWAAVATAAPSPLRGSSQVRPTSRLDLLGRNLANAWRVLLSKLEAEAQNHVMYLVRVGLGEDVERVEIVEDPSGGQVGLALRRAGLPEPIPAFMLSDGQLAWLAFVAMVRLNDGRSILAVDEPELHMHPYLINAAVALLQTVEAPVVIATHSDHILSMLEDPVAAVRVCALEDGAAVVRELDAAAFEEWRTAYTDMGQLRASGFLEQALKREE